AGLQRGAPARTRDVGRRGTSSPSRRDARCAFLAHRGGRPRPCAPAGCLQRRGRRRGGRCAAAAGAARCGELARPPPRRRVRPGPPDARAARRASPVDVDRDRKRGLSLPRATHPRRRRPLLDRPPSASHPPSGGPPSPHLAAGIRRPPWEPAGHPARRRPGAAGDPDGEPGARSLGAAAPRPDAPRGGSGTGGRPRLSGRGPGSRRGGPGDRAGGGRRRGHQPSRGAGPRARFPAALRGGLQSPGEPRRRRATRDPRAARHGAEQRVPARRGCAAGIRNRPLRRVGEPHVKLSRALSRALTVLPALAATGMLLLLVLPLAALILSTSGADFLDGLRHPLAIAALKLSLLTTSTTLVLTHLFGTPLAWWLARPPGGRPERGVPTLVQPP